MCFKSEIETSPSYGPNFCPHFLGGNFLWKTTIEFSGAKLAKGVSERVFAFFSNFDNLQLKIPVVTARHIHIQASEIEKYVVKAPCSLGQIRTNIGFLSWKGSVRVYSFHMNTTNKYIPSSMETVSSTSQHGFFFASKSSLREFYPPGPSSPDPCRQAVSRGWPNHWRPQVRGLSTMFFCCCSAPRGPSATVCCTGSWSPIFLFRGCRCSDVSMVRVGRPRGREIHPFLSKSPLIHYPYSSIASMGLFSIIYLLIYHKDPRFMSSGTYTGLDSTRTRLGTHGMVWIPSTGSWTQKTGWDPLNFWVQLSPGYNWDPLIWFCSKISGLLGPLCFFSH